MRLKSLLVLLVVLGLGVWLGSMVYERLQKEGQSRPIQQESNRIVPVEVARVSRGPIDELRSFTGTLEADQEFVVAAKVSGRVEEISVDLADTVTRGQVVARLDNDEFMQELVQVEADLAVAHANLGAANSLLEIALRELQRIEKLKERGVSSDAERDTAKANQLARSAHVKVTRAQLDRASAAVEAARIKIGYTEIKARWHGGNEKRVVAERYVDQGDTVSANAPLLRIVDLDQLVAVFYVTERDYALLSTNQTVELRNDAYPLEVFEGRVSRIAPVFRSSTRQARVELQVNNLDERLKPGMFVRVQVRLQRVEDAIILPERALVVRDGQTGVFVIESDEASVRWQVVKQGIRHGDRMQLIAPGLKGRVVTLGQQLLEDGSEITIVEEYKSNQ